MRDNQRQYVPEMPPIGGDIGTIVSWIRRELLAIHRSMSVSWDLPISSQAPSDPKNGMLRFADGTSWDPGSGEGLYVYIDGNWIRCSGGTASSSTQIWDS